MSDTVDKVNQHVSDALARNIKQHREQLTEPVHAVDGKHYCIDCDNQIRPERVAVAPDAPRCIYCQTATEKERKHFA